MKHSITNAFLWIKYRFSCCQEFSLYNRDSITWLLYYWSI